MDAAAKAVPCRLSVFLARSAPVAVVLRRGPTRWVQLIKWQTDCDRFEAGQWFKGRIYERRCDLSPDGSLLIYFASKINSRTLADSEYTHAWTAVSRPPYFTALALWPKGDCWHGGGLFLGARHIWLNHKPEVAVPHPMHLPKGLKVEPNPEACGEDWPVWFRRMERDGWWLVQEGAFPLTDNGWRTEQPEVWERSSRASGMRLRRSTDAISFQHLGGPFMESFRLVLDTGEIPVQNASWADWDQADRLVFARAGSLFAGVIENGRMVERKLIDLNANAPSPVEAPEFAKQW
jgi:hypothetical protein